MLFLYVTGFKIHTATTATAAAAAGLPCTAFTAVAICFPDRSFRVFVISSIGISFKPDATFKAPSVGKTNKSCFKKLKKLFPLLSSHSHCNY